MTYDNGEWHKQLLHGVDKEWEQMYRDYIARVPTPAYREDPPIKTRLEEQFKQEEMEFDTDTDDEV